MTEHEVSLENYTEGNERVEQEFEVKPAPATLRFKLPAKISKELLLKLSALLLVIIFCFAILIASFSVGFGVGWASNEADEFNGNYRYDYYQGEPYVYRSPKDYQLDRTNASEANIMETNEYQFKLDSSRFKNRTKGVEELYQIVAEVLQITIDPKKIEEDVFLETQYHSTDCGSISYSELRVRNYFGGKLDQSSECDINKDSSPHTSKENAMSYNLTPNPNYDNEQKIEQDVHPCWYKFNQKTKIKSLPGNFSFETCGDALELFPYSFPGAKSSSPLSTKSDSHYWESKYHTYMQHGISKVKLSFTLEYSSLEDAMKGDVKPHSGSEFSIRFYSPNEGLSYWNYKLLSEMGADYLYLLDTYGSKDYPC